MNEIKTTVYTNRYLQARQIETKEWKIIQK